MFPQVWVFLIVITQAIRIIRFKGFGLAFQHLLDLVDSSCQRYTLPRLGSQINGNVELLERLGFLLGEIPNAVDRHGVHTVVPVFFIRARILGKGINGFIANTTIHHPHEFDVIIVDEGVLVVENLVVVLPVAVAEADGDQSVSIRFTAFPLHRITPR